MDDIHVVIMKVSIATSLMLCFIDPPSAPTNITAIPINYTSFFIKWSPSLSNGGCDIIQYYISVTPGDTALNSTVNETTVTVNGTGNYTVTVSGTDSLHRPIHTLKNSTVTVMLTHHGKNKSRTVKYSSSFHFYLPKYYACNFAYKNEITKLSKH